MIELSELTKRFEGSGAPEGRAAVDRLSLEVARGELLVLLDRDGRTPGDVAAEFLADLPQRH